jgi:hypothetical protein
MKPAQHTYDWAAMLDELYEAGLSSAKIASETGVVQTHRAIAHYRRGVQPLYWRGKALLDLWCSELRKTPDDAPTQEIRRGQRVVRELVVAPRVQALPQDWPPAPPKRREGNGSRVVRRAA